MDDVNDDLDSMFEDDDKQTTNGVAEAPVATPETPKGDEPKTETPEKVDKPTEAEEANKDDGGEKPAVTDGASPEAPKEDPVGEGGEANKEQPAEAPKPLTAEEARALFQDIRTQERDSAKNLAEAEKEVIEKYYPQGLSNVLVDEKTGKEIRSPQDVVDLSDGTMTIEEGAQWLMNEQYKLDQQVAEIKKSARELAEVNSNFKQGAARVIETYKTIFEKYPKLQTKVYNNYMKAVKMDSEKDLILSAPDIEEYYRDFMEPYVMAVGAQTPAPVVAAPEAVAIPEAPKQSAADRMDVSGDGGGSGSDVDPNDPEASLNNLFGE